MNYCFRSIVAASLSAAISGAASAAIVTPTMISKMADMDFGKISSPKKPVVKQATAAKFAVSGLPFVTYAITLPENATLSDDRANTMEVGSIVSIPAANGTLDCNGTQTLKVTGVLNVPAKQPAGRYHNAGDVEVTINFN